MNKNNIITPDDVAEATQLSKEEVIDKWKEIGVHQRKEFKE